ncbi:tRNA(Ser) Um(44) 2'-O-methyltransferase [Pichia californica]|uniref:tRNA (uracil-O(2)-)-methyltransferase n=1 Tax=Pichia californica TaxID=460514 RepID=A0A9P7BCY6_9ASCO|nr:tRNA(Ser) Um(44) 2'-O-methyltransferase [[Candida] californica]KAG0687482.1 tRNA(Ser) Um(44) 2'-O-methyltransferase [[Candida] californica]
MCESAENTENQKFKSKLTKHDAWRTGPHLNSDQTLKPDEIPNIRDKPSVLGEEWCGIFEIEVDFKIQHFMTAMTNLINSPNINSTVILRADILRKKKYAYLTESDDFEIEDYINPLIDNEPLLTEPCETVLTRNLNDTEIKQVPLDKNFKPSIEIVRRIIPRNPSKDYIINQTCLIMNNSKTNSTLVLYTPHIENPDEIPFYLPPARSIGILFNSDNSTLSISYLPFKSQPIDFFKLMSPSERPIRIAYRLLGTSKKHSNGVMNGYTKRVNHDQVVPKQLFQDRYISLKQKYAKFLVDNWNESTDPRKHVFEDIAIAAFLIEFWISIYPTKKSFEFRDLGCGNGILVYILIMEGYKGEGIDARSRKSWDSFPENIKSCLKEQVLIPSVLLRPHPLAYAQNPLLTDNGQEWKVPIYDKVQHQGNIKNSGKTIQLVECYSSQKLLNESIVNVAEFPPNTFIIGNHSDELTCWIPLLGYPFMVLPCCSYNLNGDKTRYPIIKGLNGRLTHEGNSTYQGLVDHAEYLAMMCGWKVEREMLRIPSTRNSAVICYQRNEFVNKSIYEIIAMEGGAQRWVENTMALMKKKPRDH